MIIQLILIFILACTFAIVIYLQYKRKTSSIYNIYQVNDKFDTSKPSDTLYQPFNELFYTTYNIKKANLITISDYGDIDNQIDKINCPKSAYMYAIKGSDLMASKSLLAKHFKDAKLNKYIPETFILSDKELPKLDEKNIYILKKNIQRQEGTLITKDIEYINTKAANDGYVVCQELLQNPFLVNERKINMRVYLLIIPNKNMYIYNNGFMYYTPQPFKKNTLDNDNNITTGYVDRQIYIDNPLTHQDFYTFLGTDKSKLLKDNILEFFKSFKIIYDPILKKLNNNKQFRFNIFGIDIAPDESLNVKIMELNKAPDLSYKDDRDANVKLNMVKDMMNLVGIFETIGDSDNFILI